MNINEQNTFWSDLQPGQITTNLMDLLSDTLVYVKDRQGAYIHVNRVFRETLNLTDEEIIGKTDQNLFGTELASHYTQDDESVMSLQNQITEKAELVTYRPGIVKWYLTTKIPLYNRDNEVVGLAGITRPSKAHQKSMLTGPMAYLGKAVEFIYDHKNEMITVDMISAASGISISTLERCFKKHFSCSPGKFVTQVKISAACELLAEPSYSINEVGDLLGYSDPVVFTRIFKREMKITPSGYRKSLTNH